jgi:hypothetical protein
MEHTAMYHYNWSSITIHGRTDPLRAINMVYLSLIYSMTTLGLYIGANNYFSWRTRKRVEDVLRLARLARRSPLGLFQ